MWRKGNPRTLGGNVNWCSHCGKPVRRFLKKLKMEPPHDPAILLLGIYLKKTKTRMHPNVHSSFIYNYQDREAT